MAKVYSIHCTKCERDVCNIATSVRGDTQHYAPSYHYSNSLEQPQCAPTEQRMPESTTDVLGKLADLLSNRCEDLPKKAPETFKGDVYHYPAWLKSFEALVEKRKPEATDRLYYLSLYTAGEAKECIKGFLCQETMAAYEKAMSILREWYGDEFSVAQSYKRKISKWAKVKYGDGKANFLTF